MLRNIYLLLIIIALLSGCQRQQGGTRTVYNKETIADFTTTPPSQLPPKKAAQHLPGNAQIPGAPIQGFQTQTGTASVQATPVAPRAPAATPAAATTPSSQVVTPP